MKGKYKRTIEEMEWEYNEKLKRKEELETEIRQIEDENRDLDVTYTTGGCSRPDQRTGRED